MFSIHNTNSFMFSKQFLLSYNNKMSFGVRGCHVTSSFVKMADHALRISDKFDVSKAFGMFATTLGGNEPM